MPYLPQDKQCIQHFIDTINYLMMMMMMMMSIHPTYDTILVSFRQSDLDGDPRRGPGVKY